MNGLKPGALLMMGGGVLLFICSFLDWRGEGRFGVNAFETDFFGFLGIFVFLISIMVVGLVAARAFGGVKLPDNLLGFSVNQWLFIDGLIAFIITFGLLLAGDSKVGIILGTLAAAAMLAGAFMEMQGLGSPLGSATVTAPGVPGVPPVPGAAPAPPGSPSAAAPGTIPPPPAGPAAATPPPVAPPAAPPAPPQAPGTPPAPPA